MVGFLLFLLAWVGHGYWLMVTLNVIYSRPFHRAVLRAIRKLAGVLLVAGPPALGVMIGFDLLAAIDRADSWEWLPLGYLLACAALGGAWFPAVTLWRLARRRPAVVVEESTVVYDVEKELGYRPVGDGKHRRVAGWKFNGLFRVEFTTLRLTFPGLPAAWRGLTILHLSDLHLYGTPALLHYQLLMRRAMADGVPDLVVLSGDIIDGDEYLAWVEPILKELSWAVAAVAILGNHDWWQDAAAVRTRLTAGGFHVIGGTHEVIDVRGEPLVAVGHEGPWFRPGPDVSNLPDGFRLLVSHSPDNIAWARRHGFRLMLSGHNHGGQIRVPVVGSLFVPSWYSRRYDAGTFHEPPTVLHVTRGIAGKEPIRFRCPPQVTRLVLE